MTLKTMATGRSPEEQRKVFDVVVYGILREGAITWVRWDWVFRLLQDAGWTSPNEAPFGYTYDNIKDRQLIVSALTRLMDDGLVVKKLDRSGRGRQKVLFYAATLRVEEEEAEAEAASEEAQRRTQRLQRAVERVHHYSSSARAEVNEDRILVDVETIEKLLREAGL